MKRRSLVWGIVVLSTVGAVGAGLGPEAGATDEDGYEDLPLPPAGTKRTFLGFKLTRIDPGSIYEQVGLREGDLLKTMNGKPVLAPTDLKELPRILDRDRKVELKVDRGDKHLTLTYRIKTVTTKVVKPRKAASAPKKAVAKKKPTPKHAAAKTTKPAVKKPAPKKPVPKKKAASPKAAR